MSSGKFQKSINLSFVLLLVLTVLTAGLAFWSFEASASSSRALAHTHQVIGALRETFSTIQRAENGQRGFLLTGQDSYLGPDNRAFSQVQDCLARLKQVTADDPVQQRRLAVLDREVAAKMADLRETVAVRRRFGLEAAEKDLLTGRGQKAMQRVQATMAQMESPERDLLRAREQRAQTGIWSTGLVLAGSLLVEIGFLVFVRRLLRRTWTAQEHHARELEETAADLWAAKIVAEQAEEQYRAIYENALEGIFQTTPEGRLLSANPAMTRLLGYQTPEELTQALTNVAEQLYFQPSDRTRFLALMAQTGTVSAFEVQFRRRDGSILWVSLSAHLERDEAGNVLYFEGTMQDITERRQAEEALRESEERFQLFMDNSPAVTFIKDEQGRYLFINARYERVFNVTAQVRRSQTDEDFMPPAVAAEVRANDARILALNQGTELFEAVPTPDGAATFWQVYKFPFVSRTGQRLLAGIAFDVTAQRQAEEALRETSGQLEALIQASPLAIIAFDAHGVVQRGNAAAAQLFGGEGQDLTAAPEWDALRARLARGESFTNLELRCQSGNGRLDDLSVSAAPLYDVDGAVSGGMAVLADISDRKQHEQEQQLHLRQIEDFNVILEFQRAELEKANSALERIAATDTVTGLQNRRRLEEQLSLEFARATRYGLPLSLLMLDVDHFKQYNDAFGHPVGDDVLKTVGRLLQMSGRDGDLTARYGGEEFAILLPHTDSVDALKAAERFRAAVEAEDWPLRAVTVSIGVCTATPGMRDQSELVDGADRALYAAKSAGRNRVAQASTHLAALPVPRPAAEPAGCS